MTYEKALDIIRLLLYTYHERGYVNPLDFEKVREALFILELRKRNKIPLEEAIRGSS